MTDQQIIQLLRSNKTAKAFTRLYRYFPPVSKLIQSRGGSKDDALDIYQDALVILCRKAQEENFTLTASLNTYLYSICRFLWNDELKRKHRKNEIGWTDDVKVLDEGDWTTLHEEDQREKLAVKALKDIGQKCLELLQLFYTQEKSMKAIASKMEFTSENAAKNQKYKCLERAKAKLKELQEKPVNL